MKDRIRKQMGLEFNRGPLQVDSLPSLILAKYAESQGKGEVFNKAMMAAYFLEAQAIDNPEVLRQVLNKVGLPGEQLEEILENQIYRGEVEADIRQAREFDLNGVPALVFEEKYLVSGAQPYDVLRQVVEKVKEEIGE